MPEYPPKTPESGGTPQAPPLSKPPQGVDSVDPRENFDLEQAKLDKQTKANAGLKEELTTSEAADKESEQALAGYEKARPALQSKVEEANEYLSVKLPMVEKALDPEKKTAILKAIDGYKADLKKREAAVTQLEKDIRETKGEYETAAEKAKEAQAKFDEAKNTLASATANVSKFQSLMPKIEGEDPARLATMYFLTLEADEAVPDKLDEVADLQKKLTERLEALKESRKAAREKKAAWEGKVIDLAQARKALADRRASREERLLKQIAPLNKKTT